MDLKQFQKMKLNYKAETSRVSPDIAEQFGQILLPFEVAQVTSTRYTDLQHSYPN